MNDFEKVGEAIQHAARRLADDENYVVSDLDRAAVLVAQEFDVSFEFARRGIDSAVFSIQINRRRTPDPDESSVDENPFANNDPRAHNHSAGEREAFRNLNTAARRTSKAMLEFSNALLSMAGALENVLNISDDHLQDEDHG